MYEVVNTYYITLLNPTNIIIKIVCFFVIEYGDLLFVGTLFYNNHGSFSNNIISTVQSNIVNFILQKI
jgi:hypothetical protein